MGYLELALIGVGLSMDAFAVSVCKGLSMRKVDKKYMFVLAVFFGGFQALINLREIFLLAIATSIDALAIGITFAFLQVRLITSVTIIGCITFCFSIAGVLIGNVFGSKFKDKATILGGIILIGIGVKILIEHLEIFG